jgi:hypothetical protein
MDGADGTDCRFKVEGNQQTIHSQASSYFSVRHLSVGFSLAFLEKVETACNEQWSDVAESRCPKGTVS